MLSMTLAARTRGAAVPAVGAGESAVGSPSTEQSPFGHAALLRDGIVVRPHAVSAQGISVEAGSGLGSSVIGTGVFGTGVIGTGVFGADGLGTDAFGGDMGAVAWVQQTKTDRAGAPPRGSSG